MGLKLKPSSFKQTTTSETRQRKETSYGKNVRVARAGERNDKNLERWGTEYGWSLDHLGLLDDFKSKEGYPSVYVGGGDSGQINWQQRLDNYKNYISKLSPELQWQLNNYRQRRYYPSTYKKWKEVNPTIETTITEQRDTTITPGSPGYESKGGYDKVWGNMPLEEQQKYANKEEWIIAAEKWKEEQKAIAAEKEVGNWKETGRTTITT